MKNEESQNSPSEISIALRYIIKSTALMVHHKHLRPDDLNIHIPIFDYTIPTHILEGLHSFIGIVFLALWIEINIRAAIKICKRIVSWWERIMSWRDSKRGK